jgi:mRNA-degrading endonuclease RelE of RelBE toxin-antitoxin system
MSFEIQISTNFQRQAKRLKKKFPSLKRELTELFSQLAENPETGESIGNNCYKIRMAIASKGKGKSGGARVITHVQVVNKVVYLLSIYDKSEQDSISSSEISFLVKLIR